MLFTPSVPFFPVPMIPFGKNDFSGQFVGLYYSVYIHIICKNKLPSNQIIYGVYASASASLIILRGFQAPDLTVIENST
jgi:hypothetical protein